MSEAARIMSDRSDRSDLMDIVELFLSDTVSVQSDKSDRADPAKPSCPTGPTGPVACRAEINKRKQTGPAGPAGPTEKHADRAEAEARPIIPQCYGRSAGGRLLTWTGRIVAPEDCDQMTEYEWHGPGGANRQGERGRV